MTAPQQMLEIAKERGLALVQTEERHSSATNQMELSTISTESEMMVKWLLSMDWMVPGLCGKCVAMRLDLQGIHEDCGGMVISSGMGQKCVHPEAASKTYDSKVVHESDNIMDKVMKWLQTQDDKDRLGAMKFCASKHHNYLVTTREYSEKNKCRVMICDYINKSFVETVEKHGEEWRESHLMDYLNIGRDQFPVPGGKDDGWLMC
jgi:hypothetical protein